MLSEATIAAIPAYTHTGSALTPTLNIDYKGTSLVSGSDYTAAFTNNTSTGTASVTITGIGSYAGTNSTTFQIVELIPPSDVDISANKNNYSIASLAGTYSLTGYDDSTDYRVYVHIISDTTTATFNITTTSGLTPINAYTSSNFSDSRGVQFKGKPADIENALNSIQLNTTNVAGGEIKLQVFIGPDISPTTFFNPGNGHIYELVTSTNITWDRC